MKEIEIRTVVGRKIHLQDEIWNEKCDDAKYLHINGKDYILSRREKGINQTNCKGIVDQKPDRAIYEEATDVCLCNPYCASYINTLKQKHQQQTQAAQNTNHNSLFHSQRSL